MEKIILSLIICIFLISIVNAVPVCIDKTSPSPPSNLTVSGEVGNIVLTWNAAIDIPECSGIAYYDVYRDDIKIGNSNSLNFTDKDISYGTTYSYAVSAVDLVGHKGPKITGNITLSRGGITRISVGATADLDGVESTIPYDLGTLKEEQTVKVKENDKIIFNINDENHLLEVKDIGNNYVNITISSDTLTEIISVGDRC